MKKIKICFYSFIGFAIAFFLMGTIFRIWDAMQTKDEFINSRKVEYRESLYGLLPRLLYESQKTLSENDVEIKSTEELKEKCLKEIGISDDPVLQLKQICFNPNLVLWNSHNRQTDSKEYAIVINGEGDFAYSSPFYLSIDFSHSLRKGFPQDKRKS